MSVGAVMKQSHARDHSDQSAVEPQHAGSLQVQPVAAVTAGDADHCSVADRAPQDCAHLVAVAQQLANWRADSRSFLS